MHTIQRFKKCTQIQEYNLYYEERKRNMRMCVCLKIKKKPAKITHHKFLSRGHLVTFSVPIFFLIFCLQAFFRVFFAIVNFLSSSQQISGQQQQWLQRKSVAVYRLFVTSWLNFSPIINARKCCLVLALAKHGLLHFCAFIMGVDLNYQSSNGKTIRADTFQIREYWHRFCTNQKRHFEQMNEYWLINIIITNLANKEKTHFE